MQLVDFFKELVRPIPNSKDIEKKEMEIAKKVYEEMKPRYSSKYSEYKDQNASEHTL